jgi:hypothetical protein
MCSGLAVHTLRQSTFDRGELCCLASFRSRTPLLQLFPAQNLWAIKNTPRLMLEVDLPFRKPGELDGGCGHGLLAG